MNIDKQEVKLLQNIEPYAKTLDMLYHLNSKYTRGLMHRLSPRTSFKQHGTIARTMPKEEDIQLKNVSGNPCNATFKDVLAIRRSIRDFKPTRLSKSTFTELLRMAIGTINDEASEEKEEIKNNKFTQGRTYPSAGAIYPIELYVFAQSIDGIAQGIYRYECYTETLVSITKEQKDIENLLNSVMAGFDIQNAHCFILFVANWRTIKEKYLARAYRLALLEAGHVAQNFCLAASANGLGSVIISSYYDKEIEDVLKLDGINESIVSMQIIGQPKGE